MSYTTVVGVWPRKRAVEDLYELGNGHGSAPVAWEAMAGRYLNVTEAYDMGKGWMEIGDKLWDLWMRQDIPEEHRAVFFFTFDRAYVTRKHYDRFAAAIERFLKDFPTKFGNINHWRTWRDIFSGKMRLHSDGCTCSLYGPCRSGTRSDTKPLRSLAPALGMIATSVADDVWKGAWNEEKDRYDPLDWAKTHDLYKVLDSLKEKK